MSYGPNFCIVQELTPKTLIGVGNPQDGVYYFKSMHGGLVFAVVKGEAFV